MATSTNDDKLALVSQFAHLFELEMSQGCKARMRDALERRDASMPDARPR